MNRQQLLQLAQRNIDERRFAAEYNCEQLLDKLRKNPEYRICERKLRETQVAYSMSIDGDKTELKRRLDECKAEMKNVIDKLCIDEKLLRPQYSCPRCQDTGYVHNSICSCLQNELCRLITAESNVMNTSFTFKSSKENDKHNLAVYKTVQKATDDGLNVLLTGNTGSGKTYLLTACANKLIAENKSALFVTAYTLNGMFLDAHLSDYKVSQSILDTLTDVDALVIDDLGTEIYRKNVTAEYLFSVINERIARHKQTFISTNLTLKDIRDRYDERIFSRLVDKNTTVVAQLVGADKRFAK